MKLCNIWGEGALFAFSGLDGESLYSDDFPGILLDKQIGFKLYSNVRRYLVLNNINFDEVKFNVVTSDYINFTYNNNIYNIVYAKTHLIIGNSTCNIDLSQSSDFKEKIKDNYSIIDDGKDITILKVNNNSFSYAFAHNFEDAKSLVDEPLNIDEIIKNKLSYYEKNDHNKYPDLETLYYKCLSVMKTQIYSPEDVFQTKWSTPDRIPHKKMWLWDSCFHSIGFLNIDPNLSQDLLLAIFYKQHSDGFIPHMMGVNLESTITQPPVIAYAAWKIYQKTRSIDFLRKIYDHNKIFLNWVDNNRRINKDVHLYTWNLTNILTCKCDESGMDNSPRFDTNDPLYAIDFSTFMANECLLMSKIAHELYDEEESYYINKYNLIKNDMNKYLYDDIDGIYYDYNVKKSCFHKVLSVVSFLPLMAFIPDTKQVESLINHLNNDKEFNTPLPIPTISLSDKLFGTDMWRGPVWINFNYMIIEGIYFNGYKDLAKDIKLKTIYSMNKWYNKTGVISEFYDSMDETMPCMLNRKGTPVFPYNTDKKLQTIRDYGWSTTLLFDWLNNK